MANIPPANIPAALVGVQFPAPVGPLPAAHIPTAEECGQESKYAHAVSLLHLHPLTSGLAVTDAEAGETEMRKLQMITKALGVGGAPAWADAMVQQLQALTNSVQALTNSVQALTVQQLATDNRVQALTNSLQALTVQQLATDNRVQALAQMIALMDVRASADRARLYNGHLNTISSMQDFRPVPKTVAGVPNPAVLTVPNWNAPVGIQPQIGDVPPNFPQNPAAISGLTKGQIADFAWFYNETFGVDVRGTVGEWRNAFTAFLQYG